MSTVRVLHVVVSMDAGGIETMLMNYYRNIDRNKIQFDFLLHCKHKSFYEDEITSLGGRIFRVPSYHPKNQIKYRVALKRFFKEHTEYKVVHAHIGFYGMYALRAAKRNGVPVRIAHSHCANKFWRFDATLPFRIVTRHGLKRQYTDVYACSPEAAEYMAPGKAFKIMNNAINASSFAFNSNNRETIRKELGVNNELLVGHVGRFTEEKNHSFIIDIFAELIKYRPTAKLLLVGNGALYNDIKNKAKSLNIENNVILTGVRNDVYALMSAMDVLVFPSKHEGFPVTLVEAQCSDLPCVISDTFSKTAVISDRVKIHSLNDSAKIWANSLIAYGQNNDRRNNIDLIRNAGLDINSNVTDLQKVYLEAYGYVQE